MSKDKGELFRIVSEHLRSKKIFYIFEIRYKDKAPWGYRFKIYKDLEAKDKRAIKSLSSLLELVTLRKKKDANRWRGRHCVFIPFGVNLNHG